jgi:hypothetical protein
VDRIVAARDHLIRALRARAKEVGIEADDDLLLRMLERELREDRDKRAGRSARELGLFARVSAPLVLRPRRQRPRRRDD